MARVGNPVSIGDQNSPDLADAVQQIVQSMVQLQNVLCQQIEKSLQIQLQEALHHLEQQTQEAMLQQEERILEATRQQARESEERLRQREEALDQREKRFEEVLKEIENRKPKSITSDESLPKRKRVESSPEECGSWDSGMGHLGERMTKMEEAVGKALDSIFPRVELLVTHLEATGRLQTASSSNCSATSTFNSLPPSVIGSSSVPLSSQALGSDHLIRSVFNQVLCENSDHGDTVNKALLLAARGGKLNRARRLLNAGADVNYVSERGRTALICASIHGHALLVSLLLQRGADVHAKGPAGLTVLHFAAVHDHVGQCLRLILSAGARVDSRLSDGSTALHMAAMKNNYVAVGMLLDAGASKTILNDSGHMPYDIANSDVTRDLLR